MNIVKYWSCQSYKETRMHGFFNCFRTGFFFQCLPVGVNCIFFIVQDRITKKLTENEIMYDVTLH